MSRIATPNANGNYPDFDNAYWLHQAPAVRALRTTDDINTRRMMATVLAQEGMLIDTSIMVFAWDPGKIMAARIAMGYKTVTAVGFPNVVIAPGVNQGGNIGTNNPGQIKVSLDFDDYQPFTETK